VSTKPRVVIVGGHVRSGTTMLGKVMNTHPDIVMMHEFRGFGRLNRPWWRHLKGIKHSSLVPLPLDDRRKKFGELGTWWFIARYAVFLLPHFPKIRYADARRALQLCYPKARLVGDQAAQNHSQMLPLSKQKDCRVVIIHRDCRDVVQSTVRRLRSDWAEKPRMGRWDVATIATRWVRMMDRLEQADERIMKVRYEEFVADPAPTIERLGEFLQVDPAGFRTDFVRKDSVGLHRSVLSEGEMATVMEIAGPTLKRMGYVQ